MSRGPWRPKQEVNITTPEAMPLVCTPAEAARLLRCTPEYVTRLAKVGVIRGCKVGNRWRFKREDLFAYLDRQAEFSMASCR